MSEKSKSMLMIAKSCYEDFFDRGIWSDVYATERLKGRSDINKRKESIHELYKLIMNNPDISENIKYWVRSNHSIQDVAKEKGITVSALKSQIYYVNTTLGGDLEYNKRNIMEICLEPTEISEYCWREINKIIQAVKIKRAKEMYKKECILTNRNILINIPRKEYNTNVSDDRFDSFLRLIKPYFIAERKRVQDTINKHYLEEAGYINYLMTPGVSLSDLDKKRLRQIQKLLDEETIKTYRELRKDRLIDITKVQEVEEPKEENYWEQYQKGLESGEISPEVKTVRRQYTFH